MKRTIRGLFCFGTVLILLCVFAACSNKNITGRLSSSIEKNEDIDFAVIDNTYLTVEHGKNKYYVKEHIHPEKETLSYSKNIGILWKNTDHPKLSIRYDFAAENAQTAMIHGIDFEKMLIGINEAQYELELYENEIKEGLDINSFFDYKPNEMKVALNPENYEEFIDKDLNLYRIADEIKEESISHMLYPVEMEGEPVFSITFDTVSGDILGAKEKTFMLKNAEDAGRIKTIDYEGVYQTTSGDISVGIGQKYYRLLPK
ncbi:MAG: hypothetical protein Q4A78_10730 [Peptostreptococcaceae bacterium]|nr:hypothetical protein [Peptostreptococcaceae bacterium]